VPKVEIAEPDPADESVALREAEELAAKAQSQQAAEETPYWQTKPDGGE
jgi:hypothetical protein